MITKAVAEQLHRLENPFYDIVLSDGYTYLGLIGEAENLGRNPVEQSSLKTSQGNQSYSDLEPPYMTLAQDDWTGGRASREYERDVTRYKDALRANTERSTGVVITGRETYMKGLRDDVRQLPGNMRLIPLIGGRSYMSMRVYCETGFNAEELWFWLRRKGTPNAALTLAIYSDNGGVINTLLQSTTVPVADAENLVSELFVKTITTQAISSSTYYWVLVSASESDGDADHWEIGVKESAGTTKKKGTSGGSWVSDTVDLYFRITETDAGTPGFFFEYKKGQYFVTSPGDGTASKLYLNGARGLAASNTGNLDKLICGAAHGLSAAQAVGGIVMIVEGPGSTEEQNWRTVTGVPDTDEFSVDVDWAIEHTTDSVWVFIGADVWTEIDVSTYITKPVTDVLVATNDFVYFCQGEEDEIARMKEEDGGTTWDRTVVNESTNKAIHLAEYNNAGVMYLVRTNSNGEVSEGTTPATWTDVTFATGVAVGNKWDRFTGLEPYKDSSLDDIVTVFKEGGPYQWNDEAVDEMSTPEMRAVASYKNGKVHGRQGSYLFMSVQNTLWRFYHPQFDDVGPTNGEGLPANRQGNVSFFVPYPGRVIIGVDAGASGYSAVFTGTGGATWHEIYRAPLGERIRGGGFQVVPGSTPDRLYVRQGADIIYLPFPSETYDPSQDANYPFAHEGVIYIGEMTAGLYDAWKYWKALKTRSLNLIKDDTTGVRTTWIEVDYRTSEDDDWITFSDEFTDSPVQDQNFDEDYGASSRVLYLRIRMYSTDTSETPKLTAVAISGVTITAPKFSYQTAATCAFQDKLGNKEDLEPFEKVKKLDEWCSVARPLRLYSTNPLFTNIPVFLMPVPSRPRSSAVKVGEHDYIVTLILQEA